MDTLDEPMAISLRCTPRSAVEHSGLQLETHTPDWRWQSTQLASGEFRTSGLILALNTVLIAQVSISHASMHRIRAPSGCVSLLIPAPDAAAIFVGGYRIEPQECVVLSSNAELDVVTHGKSIVMSLSVSDWAWDASRLQSRGLTLHPGARLLRCGADLIAAMLDNVSAAFKACEASAGGTAHQAVRESFENLFIVQLKRIAADPAALRVQRYDRGRRHTAVDLARRYIREHLTDPIRLSDLCAHTHLQARSLEYGFRETLGLSPVSYVKVLRLNEVHRQLLSNTHGPRSISELALDAGFWHLSQFAADYRKFFLETPSATRQRASSAHLAEKDPSPRIPRMRSAKPWDQKTSDGWRHFTRIPSPQASAELN
jgi:AraC family transcriptional regulator, ethanolamine operon transcriptional activator